MTPTLPTLTEKTVSVLVEVPVTAPTVGLRLRTNVRAGECDGKAGRCPVGQHPISYTGPRGIYVTRCFDCGYDW